ncbi:MAG: PAS domain S-box protein [Capsulimonadales bacterium]|nr:PAS domain S-box protein [Capsulimonadales bacterium]
MSHFATGNSESHETKVEPTPNAFRYPSGPTDSAGDVLRSIAETVDALEEAFVLLDPEGNYLYVNPQAARLAGCAPQDLIGRNAWELFPKSANGPIRDAFLQTRSERIPVRLETISPTLGRRFAMTFYPQGENVAVHTRDITEHHRTEEALAETARSLAYERERLTVALRAANLGMYEWRVGEETIRWSPETYPVFGVDPETFVPTVQAFDAMVHPEDREELWRKTRESLDLKEVFTHEYRIIRPDGSVRWLANRSHIGTDPEGRPERVTGVTTDITERKRAEEAFRNRSQQFETLLNQAPLGVYLLDSDFRVREANPIVRASVGEISGGLIGRGFEEVAHQLWEGTFADRIVEIFRRTLNTGEPFACAEEEGFGHDGQPTGFFEWRVDRITLPDDGRFGLVCYARDITQQVRARRALEESERLFRTLGEAIPLHLWMADAGGTPLYQNPAWHEYTGMTTEEFVMSGWEGLHHPDEMSALRRTWEEAIRLGKPIEVELRLRRRDGVFRWFACRTIPIWDAQGRVTKWVGTHLDIDERKRIEEALEERNREVEALNHQLRRAMTETHHRVKNNLQLISALIDLQQLAGPNRERASELANLSHNVSALAVIHDILTQETKAGNDPETVSAKAVLERLLEATERTVAGRPVRADIEDVRLTGKQTTTLALVTNELISNAIKHGAGPIDIDFRTKDRDAVLTVDDDGPGFPPGFDVSTAAQTGLELIESVVRWDLRGSVSYGNRPEGGARIIVRFPRS